MKKLFGKLLNRLTVIAVLVIVQIVWLLHAFFGLAQYTFWINAALTIVSLFMVLYLIRKDLNPAYKIAWMLICCLTPVLGGILYVLFGDKRPSRGMRMRMERVQREHISALAQPAEVQEQMEPRAASISRYLSHYGPCPAWDHTASAYFPLGDDAYVRMLQDLEGARHFIFLEYFIISEGEMWRTVSAILKRKAQEGVDVRLIYDDVGSAPALPAHLHRELAAAGVRCMAFNPMVPLVAIVMNHRDHRKILVVDGHIGYTGGINIADEYINRIVRFGHWKDTAVRLEGAAVWNFTVMFLNVWNAFSPTDPDYDRFRPERQGPLPESDGILQPYMDSPLDEEALGENVYLDILSQAQDYVYICTPYLIIDNEMLTALRLAAKRGVDVRILVPGVPDKRLVYRLTRSYFPPLLRAGVQIYTYTPGFLHAKSFVSDGRTAVVGSINLDYRSLYLHFEDAVLLSGCRCIAEIRRDFLQTAEKSRPVRISDCRDSFLGSLFDDLLRLLSPLL